MKESVTQDGDTDTAEVERGVRSGQDAASDVQDQKLKDEGKKKEEIPLFLKGKGGNQGNEQDEKDETEE